MKSSTPFRLPLLFIAPFLCGWCLCSLALGWQTEPEHQVERAETMEEIEDRVFKKLHMLLDISTTADHLFEKMASEQSYYSERSDLKGKELEKAKTVLRTKYKFRSIRDRMAFQGNLAPNPNPERFLNEVNDSTYGQRPFALALLHSKEVDEFINRPGRGYERAPIISPHDLTLESQWIQRINSRPVDSNLLAEPTVMLEPLTKSKKLSTSYIHKHAFTESGMPTTNLINFFHERSSQGFAEKNSLGLVRNLDEVAGFEPHQVRIPHDWNGSIQIGASKSYAWSADKPNPLDIDWKLNRLQLMSLLLHDEPCVYESERLPNMEELSGVDAETRALNDFESESLKKLREGEDIVTHATTNRLVMVGALRAQENCLQCHAVKEGELLGAFSYEFLSNRHVQLRTDGK